MGKDIYSTIFEGQLLLFFEDYLLVEENSGSMVELEEIPEPIIITRIK